MVVGAVAELCVVILINDVFKVSSLNDISVALWVWLVIRGIG